MSDYRLSRLLLMEGIWPKALSTSKTLNRPHLMWYLLLAGMVKRFHAVPTITQDTVGAHSFRMLWWCQLLKHTDQEIRPELQMAVAKHDIAELTVGDVSGPTKRRLGIQDALHKLEEEVCRGWLGLAPSGLADWEQKILQLADAADGMMYCCYERAMGNSTIEVVFNSYRDYFIDHVPSVPQLAVLHDIELLWRIFNEQ